MGSQWKNKFNLPNWRGISPSAWDISSGSMVLCNLVLSKYSWHAFLSWFFILDRCPTKDRITIWRIKVNPNCLLGSTGIENWNHILFDCNFSFSVWSSIASRCGVQPLRDWSQTIHNMESLRGPNLNRRLILLSWQTTIYSTWAE